MRARPVVVIPVNGLGNRLRAIVGAYSLAARHHRELRVLWEPDSFLSENYRDLFQPLKGLSFIDRAECIAERLIPSTPLGLYLQEASGFLTLKGYDKGEQPFIRRLDRLMAESPHLGVVIQAGDYFHPRARNSAAAGWVLRKTRRRIYSQIFAEDLRIRANHITPTEPFVGLSLRGTDLTAKVPNPEALIQVAIQRAKSRCVELIYVSSESNFLRTKAASKLLEAGLSVNLNPAGTGGAASIGDAGRVRILGEQAVIDFIVLGQSRHYVGPAESTFVTEITATRPLFSYTLLR